MTLPIRKKRLPSVAFILTLVTGLFWTWFALAEAASGYSQEPRDNSFFIGGLMEAATIGLPFIVIAILLWFKPKLGGILLILLGLGYGIWMFTSWNIEPDFNKLIAPMWIAGLPFLLGIFTLIRESRKSAVS